MKNVINPNYLPREKGVIGLIKWLPWFLTVGIWRFTGDELGRWRKLLLKSAQVIILAVRGFENDRLMVKASALVYYTLFALVPVLALLLALGRGFGVQDMLIASLQNQMTEQQMTLMPVLMNFVEKYLSRASGGVFVGVGVAMLLWSVMSAFNHVEKIFNDIWQVKKSRNYLTQFTTYFSMMLTLPILLVASSGLSMFLVSTFSDEYVFGFLSTWLVRLIKLLPFVINILMFTAVFMIFPNTKVRFTSALIAGVVTGIAFQAFQYLYINGQAFLSSYNAVYGAFAVIPLLLLWMQISWLIVLLGAELSYAVQNAEDYQFDADLRHLSVRYRSFMCLSIMTMIVKRMVAGKEAYTPEVMAEEYGLPGKLVKSVLNQLHDAKMVVCEEDDRTQDKHYYPAVDVSRLTVSMFMERIEAMGVETINGVEQNEYFAPYWRRVEEMKNGMSEDGKTLLKDL